MRRIFYNFRSNHGRHGCVCNHLHGKRGRICIVYTFRVLQGFLVKIQLPCYNVRECQNSHFHRLCCQDTTRLCNRSRKGKYCRYPLQQIGAYNDHTYRIVPSYYLKTDAQCYQTNAHLCIDLEHSLLRNS